MTLNKTRLPLVGLGLLLMLMLPLLLASCAMPKAFREHLEFIEREVIDNPDISAATLQSDQLSLAYHYAGNANKAVVVWVHGTPGSWRDIGRLLVNKNFLQAVKLVSIDRPGWGASHQPDNTQVYPSFAKQSYYISPLLVQLKSQHPNVPLILAGHSWGGSLVPHIAADNIDIVDGVLVLAGGLSPQLTQPRWHNKLARVWPIKAIIGNDLRQSNIEMYALAANLTGLADRWPELANMPIVVVQGGKDPLVNPANADYIETVLQQLSKQAGDEKDSKPAVDQASLQKVLRKPDYGHLLQIKHTDLIAGCVFELLENKSAESKALDAKVLPTNALPKNGDKCS